jgi:hypothetical protein
MRLACVCYFLGQFRAKCPISPHEKHVPLFCCGGFELVVFTLPLNCPLPRNCPLVGALVCPRSIGTGTLLYDLEALEELFWGCLHPWLFP